MITELTAFIFSHHLVIISKFCTSLPEIYQEILRFVQPNGEITGCHQQPASVIDSLSVGLVPIIR
ncbi:MAG: hypothetical protein PUP93_25500 [Rhizonema sp. NSF051]|nr:hypothetical protein [Rhizonema sp. NSF051]